MGRRFLPTRLGDVNSGKRVSRGITDQATKTVITLGSNNTVSLLNPLTKAQGGTGSATASGALENLGIVRKVKTADESITSSTTLQDDDHLAGWSLTADKQYLLRGFLYNNGGQVVSS